ncbi:hypothetical protein P7E02_14370 [Enterococcus hulanensis]|uniref:hypothetical protein n=1 Tax=Enterococcus hulanensis TaxID=2559929 RepID=UPI00288EE744|nr:hypothetical protein [Enterococcus hulanensis]MDT2661061.1 hypothetical protein [Enterococcus hulanensis]
MSLLDFFQHISHLDWKNIIQSIKDFILPVTSLVFSSFAFYNSYSDKKTKKFNLKLDFFSPCEEWLIDREDNDEPDVYHQYKYRIIDSVLLTNNSSLPVTVTKFSISEIKEDLNVFTMIGNDYTVTLKSPYTNLPNGGQAYSGNSLKKVANLSKFPPLPLPITIPPYESKITTLVFRYDDSLMNKKLTINTHTSRGISKTNRLVSSTQISQLVTDYTPPQLDEFD